MMKKREQIDHLSLAHPLKRTNLRKRLAILEFGLVTLVALLIFVFVQKGKLEQWINFLVLDFVTSDSVTLDKGLYKSQSMVVQALGARQRTPAAGPLRVDPINPRYFTDGQGNIVYLTGSHTWSNFIDSGGSDPPPVFDYTAYLDFLQMHHHNFFRLWRAENTKGGEIGDNYWFSPMPYQRTGPGTALDGKPKFDLTKFNQTYFDRMRTRIVAARERGIYVSIMLFDGWSVESQISNHNPWPGHPFHASNNINGINGDVNGNGQGEDVHTLHNPTITALQEAYVRQVIDTVNDLDNVLYEISNESNSASKEWQYAIVNFIKNYEASKPKQHPVGLTVERHCLDNEELFSSPADWVSSCFDINNPSSMDGRKVFIGDTDHPCGICGNQQWVWKTFTRGGNPIFMDPYDGASPGRGAPPNYDPNNANDVNIRKNMGYTWIFAERINLRAMTPHSELCSSGYCLANPSENNAAYLVYLPAGSTVAAILESVAIQNRNPELYLPPDSSVTVDLTGTPTELMIEWFNPETGATIDGGKITGGAPRSFTAPFTGDAVLYLYQKPPPSQFRLYLPVVGEGSVSAAPAGPYTTGQTVTLSASPAPGWAFSAWSGAVTGSTNPIALTISQDQTITATFIQTAAPTTTAYTVTLRIVGEGAVALAATGPFTAGQTIQATALPDPSWTFTGWSGDWLGPGASHQAVITDDLAITATFATNQLFVPTATSK